MKVKYMWSKHWLRCLINWSNGLPNSLQWFSAKVTPFFLLLRYIDADFANVSSKSLRSDIVLLWTGLLMLDVTAALTAWNSKECEDQKNKKKYSSDFLSFSAGYLKQLFTFSETIHSESFNQSLWRSFFWNDANQSTYKDLSIDRNFHTFRMLRYIFKLEYSGDFFVLLFSYTLILFTSIFNTLLLTF